MERMDNKIVLTYGSETIEVNADFGEWQSICLVYDHIKTELTFYHNGQVTT